MSITRRLVPVILTLSMLELLLVSCTNTAFEKATLTPQATLTPLPSATPTITPTATITPEPTMAPAEAADVLGLRSEPYYQERTFTYREISGETYLVDEHNGAPKAVKNEDGTWRKLDYTNPGDAELMYGHLVPEGGEYINPEMNHTRTGGEHRNVWPRFLGDWEARPINYKDSETTVFYILGGLRDGGGGLHVVRLAFEAPDVLPEHHMRISCSYDNVNDGSGVVGRFVELKNQLPSLRAGEEMSVDVWERDRAPETPYFQMPLNSLENNTGLLVMVYLYDNYPELFQMSAEEKLLLGESEWPERPVTLALIDFLTLNRVFREECFK